MRVSAMTVAATAAVTALGLAGCRGGVSREEPFHLVGDMDWQPKKQPQEASPLFKDGRAMRPLVEGTVAQGYLKDDEAYWHGTLNGKTVKRVPVNVDLAMIERGRERFNVFCAPCHDEAGGGRGMAVQRGMSPPISYGGDRLFEMTDGDIFGTITHGVRNMPGYASQITVDDRWAIVTWVRVLARSQWATTRDVPGNQRGSILPPEEDATKGEGGK